jgi:hypothetical protein
MTGRGKTKACHRAVSDAERSLAGHCVDHYRQYGVSPPPWAVVNDLAHGTPSALTKRATTRIMWSQSHLWESAERDLAATLILAASPEQIVDLQPAGARWNWRFSTIQMSTVPHRPDWSIW